MDSAAKDDAERQRNRSRLYQPPKQARGSKIARSSAAGGRRTGMNQAAAQALVADLAGEDRSLKRG